MFIFVTPTANREQHMYISLSRKPAYILFLIWLVLFFYFALLTIQQSSINFGYFFPIKFRPVLQCNFGLFEFRLASAYIE